MPTYMAYRNGMYCREKTLQRKVSRLLGLIRYIPLHHEVSSFHTTFWAAAGIGISTFVEMPTARLLSRPTFTAPGGSNCYGPPSWSLRPHFSYAVKRGKTFRSSSSSQFRRDIRRSAHHRLYRTVILHLRKGQPTGEYVSERETSGSLPLHDAFRQLPL